MSKPATKLLLSKVPTRAGKNIDLFICSASFEARCLSVAEGLREADVKRAFVCYNIDQVEIMAENKNRLMSIFGEAAVEVQLKMNDPLYTADSLVSQLEELELSGHKIKKCLVDITSFTHESLLILTKVLSIYLNKKSINIKLIYTAASSYSTNEDDNNKWLTRGIGQVRTVLGYSGEFIPSQPTHLVILVGYEAERAHKLIDIFEPAKISIGMPRKEESISSKLYEINKLTYQKMPEPNIHTFSFSCINPTQTKVDVCTHIENYPGFNVVIATLNNKISTVGVALLALTRPDIQLCYASASQYNIKGYSTPDKYCYLFDLSFEIAID